MSQLPRHRAITKTLPLAAAAMASLALSGCSMFGNGSASATASAPAGASSSASGSATGTAAAGSSTTGASPGASTSASAPKPSVTSMKPKPGAPTPTCNTPGVAGGLGLATGALHTYVVKPAGAAKPINALATKDTRAKASKAVLYAAGQISSATTMMSGCSSNEALTTAAKLEISYLTGLSRKLTAGNVTAANLTTALALNASLLTKAAAVGLKVVEKTPPATIVK